MSIKINRLLAVLVGVALSCSAHATLQGRDLNGSIDSFEAYYDTDLNITWLADADYAKTSGYVYFGNGQVSFNEATGIAATFSFTDGVNVYDNWRLPVNNGSCFGFNCTDNELGHLFYEELGNKGYYSHDGANPQAGWGLANTGPFTNLVAGPYMSGPAPVIGLMWFFGFDNGQLGQIGDGNGNLHLMLVVSDGDVGIAAVPEATTWAMMFAGLALVGVAARRRRG